MSGTLFEKITLGVFALCTGAMRKGICEEQLAHNRNVWPTIPLENGYLEDQRTIDSMLYGRAGRLASKLFFHGRPMTAAENSCEVIAVFNALRSLYYDISFPELLAHFSEGGICLNGCFGTSPLALERYFDKIGFEPVMLVGCEINEESLTAFGKKYDAFILTSFNNGRNPFSMVHSMCISKDENGFTRHNDNGTAKTEDTLFKAVGSYNGYRSHPICLITIKAPAKAE